jgi:hypothetical protein
MINFTSKDLIKYSVFALIIYYLIKIIPTTQITQRDIVLIMITIGIAYYFINYIKKEAFSQLDSIFVSATMEPKSFQPIPSEVRGQSTMEPKSDIRVQSTMEPKQFTKIDSDIKIQGEMIPTVSEEKLIISEMIDEESRIITQEDGKFITQEDSKIIPQEESRIFIDEQTGKRMIIRKITRNGQIQYITEPAPDDTIEKTRIIDATSQRTNGERTGAVITTEIIAVPPTIQVSGDKTSGKFSALNVVVDDNSKKYFNLLMEDLFIKGILDNTDMDNLNKKINLNIFTLDEAIAKLEKLRGEGIKKKDINGSSTDPAYEESSLPTAFYQPLGDETLAKWDNEFALLNTNKWSVPMPRPPVCINTSPCKVCPASTSGNLATLKEWNSNRKVMNTKESRKIIDSIPEVKL